MFDVGASQTIAAHDPVTRRARPTALNRKRAHATAQNQSRADHGGRPAAKAVIIMTLDLDSTIGPVGITGERGENSV
jgi:hypothetical protein